MISEKDKIEYINSLDLYILSHGGVGSNYLIDYLQERGLAVKTNIKLYQNTCHYSYKLVPDKKTIYIYGNIIESIISQYKRGYLHVNATKIHKSRDYNHENLEYFIKNYPDDPIGIKKQINSLKNSKNTVFIEYPYDKDNLENAFKILNLKIDLKNFNIKNRNTILKIEDLHNYDNILQNIIKVYINYDYKSEFTCSNG